MKKIKLLIMSGGTLILLGIILKVLGVVGPWPAICFSVGGALKILYMVIGARTGQVKIGSEIILLVLGLAFIFLAIYFRRTIELAYLYIWFLSIGIIVKAIFIVLFVKRQKKVVVLCE